MNNYLNKKTAALSPYIAGEQPKDKTVIKLNTNENPYHPAPAVEQALHNIKTDLLRLYPDPQCSELRLEIAKRHNVKIENVFAGNGSDEVLAFAFAAFFESTTTQGALPVLFPDITYSFYPVWANLFSVPHKEIPLDAAWTINVDDYKIPCGGIVFPNPNAPTGIAISTKKITTLAAIIKDKVLVVDEAYSGFGSESVVPYIKENPNLLVVQTLSKNSSLAGLRLGYAIGSTELIEGLCRVRDSFNSYTVDLIAQTAATAALRSLEYYKNINKKIIETRTRLINALTAMGWTVLPSCSNFVFVKPNNISGELLFNKLKNNNILVRHFNKEKIKDFVRVSIGTDSDIDNLLKVCKEV